jgi:hypothetical protein
MHYPAPQNGLTEWTILSYRYEISGISDTHGNYPLAVKAKLRAVLTGSSILMASKTPFYGR